MPVGFRSLDISYKSAWFMMHTLREATWTPDSSSIISLLLDIEGRHHPIVRPAGGPSNGMTEQKIDRKGQSIRTATALDNERHAIAQPPHLRSVDGVPDAGRDCGG
jgi:hypothetical protein